MASHLSYPQMRAIEDALNHHQEHQKTKFKTMKDLATVLTKTLGFNVTHNNLRRIFKECNLEQYAFVERSSSNSLISRIDRMDKEIAQLRDKVETLESLIDSI